MTAVVAQPMTRRQVPVRRVSGRRRSVPQGSVRPRVRVATATAPDVRRAHPAAPSGRPAGTPAPSLRRGALPEHLQLSPRPTQGAGRLGSPGTASGWRLTDRAIRLIFAVLVTLMLTSLAVVVVKLVQVTSPTATTIATTVSGAVAR